MSSSQRLGGEAVQKLFDMRKYTSEPEGMGCQFFWTSFFASFSAMEKEEVNIKNIHLKFQKKLLLQSS